MSVPEGDVLRPRDPKVLRSDDWPEFSIAKVNVVSQSTGKPVSLLSAHKDNPVKVTGRLEEVEDQWSSSSVCCPNGH